MNGSNELPFRIVFGVLWIVYFAVRLYYQRRVKVTGGYTHVNQTQEKRYFGLFALAYLALPLYFLTPWVDFASIPLPNWLRWVGAGVYAAGIGLFGWCHQVLGNNWTAILALSQSHELVTSGPYARVRHPMYSAFFVIGFGMLLLSANWLVSGIYLVTFILMYVKRVAAEETMMLERFGEVYRTYLQRTGRLWPRF